MMLKHALFLLFLYGIKNGGGSPQDQTEESRDVLKNGIKKNEVGANGLEANWEKVARNFQNPVLEYLLQKNPERTSGGSPRGGLVREIRHSQTLLFPNFPGRPLAGHSPNQLPQLESQTKSPDGGSRNPDDLPFDNFWNYLKNKTQPGGNKIQESTISSPVLHLSKNQEDVREESTRIQMYPAVAVVIHSFNKDGSLRSSVTHFQPDFKSILTTRPDIIGKEAIQVAGGKSPNKTPNNPTTVTGYVKPGHNPFSGGSGHAQESRQVFSWPFANYFPVVINDPYSSVHNAYVTGMYNAVSSIVEYGPGADICLKEKTESENRGVMNRQRPEDTEKVPSYYRNEHSEASVTNIFDEVTTRSDSFDRSDRKRLKSGIEDASFRRKRRDATSIYVKSREGDTVDVTLQEPTGSDANQRISNGSNLILRKGGVAIAGPGGAATAYTGGTAIVGPYGTVYKSPEGTAILGPFSKIVDITDDTSFEEILRMHKEMQSHRQQEPTIANAQQPSVGFENFRNYFSYKTNLPVRFDVKPQARSFAKTRPKIVVLKQEGIVKAIEEIKKTEFRRIVQDMPFEERIAKDNETALVFRPKSKAEAGRNGVALSAPTSHAILFPGQKASIYFEPESVASAGPSGFAHAHSDLFVTYVPDNTTVVQPGRRRRSPKTLLLKKLN